MCRVAFIFVILTLFKIQKERGERVRMEQTHARKQHGRRTIHYSSLSSCSSFAFVWQPLFHIFPYLALYHALLLLFVAHALWYCCDVSVCIARMLWAVSMNNPIYARRHTQFVSGLVKLPQTQAEWNSNQHACGGAHVLFKLFPSNRERNEKRASESSLTVGGAAARQLTISVPCRKWRNWSKMLCANLMLKSFSFSTHS